MWHFKYTLLWLLLISTVTISARSIPTINAEKAHEAARQQVVWRNRVCPLALLFKSSMGGICVLMCGKTNQ